MTRQLPIYHRGEIVQDMIATVDDEDYEKLSQFEWKVTFWPLRRGGKRVEVFRNIKIRSLGGKCQLSMTYWTYLGGEVCGLNIRMGMD